MIYVMSDIHGNKEKYFKMLEKINLTDDDTLIILGDVLDRGPNSLVILDDIMSRKNVEFLLGNHEYALLTIIDSEREFARTGALKYQKEAEMWKNYIFDPLAGGKKTYELFTKKMSLKESAKYLDFFRKCEIDKYLEVNGQKFYLAHASVGLNNANKVTNRMDLSLLYILKIEDGKLTNAFAANLLDLCDQESIRNLKTHIEEKKKEGYDDEIKIIVGHTPVKHYFPSQMDMKIINCGNNFCIDCGCSGWGIRTMDAEGYKKNLACLRLDDMKEFYV